MPNMTEREFQKHIKDKNLKNLYFIYGDDTYNVVRFRDGLVKQIVGENTNSLNYVEMDGQNLNIDKLAMSVELYPIASSKKCIAVKNLDVDLLNSDDFEKLIDTISDIPEYCCVIISQTTIKIEKKCSARWKKIISVFEKLGIALKLENKTVISIEKQVIKWAEKQGKILSPKNAAFICKTCGSDLINLKNEIDKICAFEESNEISEKSIKLLLVNNLETNVFEMCKMMAKGKKKESLMFLRQLLFLGEEPVAILGVISSAYIDMYRVKVAIEYGCQSSYISSVFDYKRKEFRLSSAEKNSVGMSLNSIKKIIDILIKADLNLKSSRVNPQLLLELTVVKIMMLQNNR